MSRFVEKTFDSLNSLLNNSGLFQTGQDKSLNKFQFLSTVDSKSFANKLQNVESKQEEEEIVTEYLHCMKKRLSDPNVCSAEIESIVKICMVCGTLGYPASFVYVHSLKLAQKGNLQEKHTGYLAAAYFLHPDHELIILLINTMQKDLCSSNHMEVLFALTSVCNLINTETVHNVLHLVEDKLTHENSSVRKLAILTLGHCLQLADSVSAYQMALPKLEKTLMDSELEVVSMAVREVHKIIQKVPGDFEYLIESLVHLQDQILLRRIPRDMHYCDIPAPWLQIDILKLLSFLCAKTNKSEAVVPVLKKTLQQVGVHHILAHAVMYQAIETVTSIETRTELTEMILSCVSSFLKSKNVNLKLMGIEALILIVKKMKPSIAAAQQEIIMECLKLPDETLQHKTLELLYQLANPSNVQAICKKMVEFLLSSVDNEKRKSLALKILSLAEKFIDRQDWYISVVNTIILEAGDLLPPSDIHSIINIITKDKTLKELAKGSCVELCKKGQHCPSSLTKLAVSVLTSTSEFEEITPLLLQEADESATSWLLVSLMETVLKTKEISPGFVRYLQNLEVKHGCSQQVHEQLLVIIECFSDLKEFCPEEVDPSLTFLDNIVIQGIKDKSSCYQPPSFRLAALSVNQDNTFKSESFSVISSELQDTEHSEKSPSQKSPAYNAFSSPSTSFQSLAGEKDFHLPMPRVENIWTSDGRRKVSKTDDNSAGDIKEKSKEKDQEMQELFAGMS